MQKEVYWQWWSLLGSAAGLLLGLLLWPFAARPEGMPVAILYLIAAGHMIGWAAAMCYRWATRWQDKYRV